MAAPTPEDLKADVVAALMAVLGKATSADISDLKPQVEDLAYRSALYASRAALGEDTTVLLGEVQAQAELLGSRILRRESRAAADAFRAAVDFALDLLARLLKRVIV
jgi:hypothetical protein